MATSIGAKVPPVVLSVTGVVLILLGLSGEFTYIDCAPGAFSCIRDYCWDLFAILYGIVAGVAGLIVFPRTMSSR